MLAYAKMMESTPQNLTPALYVVATPIGNLRDISFRALDILRAADLIACEDTRTTNKLCQAYAIKTPLLSYHDHNAHAVRPKILQALEEQKIIALVSDAGTPLISDPGYNLVRAAIENGHKLVPIPGANAALSGLIASGLPTDHFMFLGFFPQKPQLQKKLIDETSRIDATLILLESPRRLVKTLKIFAQYWPTRNATIAREMTKVFEEFQRNTLAELEKYYTNSPPPKGEIVIVIGPPPHIIKDQTIWHDRLDMALQYLSVKDAASMIAAMENLPRQKVYKAALAKQAQKTNLT